MGKRRIIGLGASWLALALVVAPGASPIAHGQTASSQNAYAITEMPVVTGSVQATHPTVNGSIVAWVQNYTVKALNLDSGQHYVIPEPSTTDAPPALDRSRLAYVFNPGTINGQQTINLLDLATGTSTTLVPPDPQITSVALSGNRLLYASAGTLFDHSALHLHDFTNGSDTQMAAAGQYSSFDVALAGDIAAWRFMQGTEVSQIVVQRLTSGQRWTVVDRASSQRAPVGRPAVSEDGFVVWADQDLSGLTNQIYRVHVFNPADGSTHELASTREHIPAVAVSGNVVVWAQGSQILGYDLGRATPFVVSRAVGGKDSPAISGSLVAWQDLRHNPLGKGSYEPEIYAARLAPGPAPLPPAYGVPDAVGAKIEIVWPTGRPGQPAPQARTANIDVYLLLPATSQSVACWWNPTVRLWKAVDNQPAQPLPGKGVPLEGSNQPDQPQADFPRWTFADVDVSEATQPGHRISFVAMVDGTPTRSNVWLHSFGSETSGLPTDQPSGVGAAAGPLDAKIEVVWPHADDPRQANITAMLFQHGSLVSVPPDFDAPVTLLGATNRDVLTTIGTGGKRIVEAAGLSYPVWDFNNVDISRAVDGASRYAFMLSVVDHETYSNVRTYGDGNPANSPGKDIVTSTCASP